MTQRTLDVEIMLRHDDVFWANYGHLSEWIARLVSARDDTVSAIAIDEGLLDSAQNILLQELDKKNPSKEKIKEARDNILKVIQLVKVQVALVGKTR
jgi:uncharacterized membrane protein